LQKGISYHNFLDIRLIAATNQNLQEMAKEKHFREDLWFRFNVFPIWIPFSAECTGKAALPSCWV
jgi:transcriptional regulator with GAF, ATPase, and Fis domain